MVFGRMEFSLIDKSEHNQEQFMRRPLIYTDTRSAVFCICILAVFALSKVMLKVDTAHYRGFAQS